MPCHERSQLQERKAKNLGVGGGAAPTPTLPLPSHPTPPHPHLISRLAIPTDLVAHDHDHDLQQYRPSCRHLTSCHARSGHALLLFASVRAEDLLPTTAGLGGRIPPLLPERPLRPPPPPPPPPVEVEAVESAAPPLSLLPAAAVATAAAAAAEEGLAWPDCFPAAEERGGVPAAADAAAGAVCTACGGGVEAERNGTAGRGR